MGRPAPEYGIAVTDEQGRQVEPGDVGELRVHGTSGVSLFAGYLGAPELTAAAFDEHGWFRTGDRVRLDSGGFLWFVERDQDVLKVGGENIGRSGWSTTCRAPRSTRSPKQRCAACSAGRRPVADGPVQPRATRSADSISRTAGTMSRPRSSRYSTT